MEVSQVIGEDRIRQNSNLALTIVLRREKDKKPLVKLSPEEGVKYMLKHDFCNPHQLIRSTAKLQKRKAFFKEIFKRAPVYLLNTIETPEKSLTRLKNLIDEID
jgi:hypothetical protein